MRFVAGGERSVNTGRFRSRVNIEGEMAVLVERVWDGI